MTARCDAEEVVVRMSDEAIIEAAGVVLAPGQSASIVTGRAMSDGSAAPEPWVHVVVELSAAQLAGAIGSPRLARSTGTGGQVICDVTYDQLRIAARAPACASVAVTPGTLDDRRRGEVVVHWRRWRGER
jgi:hypothetical protein